MLIAFSECAAIVQALHGVRVEKVFHVGAHLGEEAGAYAASGVKKVTWFEANPVLIGPLMENLKRYSIEHYVIQGALFDKEASLILNVTNNFQSSSLFRLKKHADYYPEIIVTSTVQVTTHRLDAIIQNAPPILPWHDFDLINIDTQGAELAILRGLGDFIAMPSLKAIYVEVNSEPLYDGIPLIGDMDAFLASVGFARVKTVWTGSGWGDALYMRAVEQTI